jgi:hypothetical protein
VQTEAGFQRSPLSTGRSPAQSRAQEQKAQEELQTFQQQKQESIKGKHRRDQGQSSE